MNTLESIKNRMKNTRKRAQRRFIDRRHKCERCPEVYYCEPCSEAATKSVQTMAAQGISLYAGGNRKIGEKMHRFFCPACRSHRKKAL